MRAIPSAVYKDGLTVHEAALPNNGATYTAVCAMCHGRKWITDDVDCPNCDGHGHTLVSAPMREVYFATE